MDSRRKHGLKELWWLLFTVCTGVSILCTSMLAGRRLSSEKSTEICHWNSFATQSGSDDDDGKNHHLLQWQQNQKQQQQTPPLVDQVLLIIIDALTPRVALGPKNRHSHQHHDSNMEKSTSSYFTYIRESIEETQRRLSSSSSSSSSALSPSSFFPSRGFFSVADAPTTTAQRTKAMVTGTIPVLLEAGTSFNSFTVEEDNLIEKLKGRTTVLGDDTWVRLFPDKERHWQEAHVFESFDVRDLDTVDDGVLEHLNNILVKGTSGGDDDQNKELSLKLPQQQQQQQQQKQKQQHPKFVIAHFLGVDHAGHRYSARDSHLYRKVEQLNKVLRNVSSVLRERASIRGNSDGGVNDGDNENGPDSPSAPVSTLLMVMGDHGMTESGDHGGSTPSETDTFLFTQIFDSSRRSSPSSSSFPKSSFMDFISAGQDFSNTIRTEHCSISRLCRLTRSTEIKQYCDKVGCTSSFETSSSSSTSFTSSSFSSSTTSTSPLTAIHQIDLVPTLAAIFNVPIPKQNLGKVIPEILLQVLISTCYGRKSSNHDHHDHNQQSCQNFFEINKMLARFFACNVRQLRSAFCSEFSAHHNPTYQKFCQNEVEISSPTVSSSSSSASTAASSDNKVSWTTYFSDENIIKLLEKEGSDRNRSTSSSTSTFSPLVKELDRIAAELTRAAREELTDVDWVAVVVAILTMACVGTSSVPFLMFSQATAHRSNVFSLPNVVAKHASYSQLRTKKLTSEVSDLSSSSSSLVSVSDLVSEDFKSSLVKVVFNWAILIIFTFFVDLCLVYAGNCRSNIVLFVAVPIFISNVMSTDHRMCSRMIGELFLKKRNEVVTFQNLDILCPRPRFEKEHHQRAKDNVDGVIEVKESIVKTHPSMVARASSTSSSLPSPPSISLPSSSSISSSSSSSSSSISATVAAATTPLSSLSLSAFAIFVLYGWRIGVHFSNSLIVREEVMVVTLAVVGLVLCRHVEGLHCHHQRSPAIRNKFFRDQFSKIVIIGCLLSVSITLGRRVRDFDSHFVDAQSAMQRIVSDYFDKSSVWTKSNVDYFNSNLHRVKQEQDRQGQDGGFKYFVATTVDVLSWLFVDTPFIHLMMISTLIFLFLVVKVLPRALTSTTTATPATKRDSGFVLVVTFLRDHSWSIFFVVAFIWNATVSNVTSLPAFLLQCVTLFLWARWFPLARFERNSNDNNTSSTETAKLIKIVEEDEDGGGGGRNSPSMRSRQLCNALDGFVLHLFGWVFFFSSGFHCMFSTIDWNVAFIGVSSVNLVAGGCLIVLHTLRSFAVVLVCGIYLDGIQRRRTNAVVREKPMTSLRGKCTAEDAGNDEFDGKEKHLSVVSSSFGVIGVFPSLCWFNATLMVTMVHSMVRHKGHLMVWEVFFPRFAFESGVLLLTVLALIVVQFFCGAR